MENASDWLEGDAYYLASIQSSAGLDGVEESCWPCCADQLNRLDMPRVVGSGLALHHPLLLVLGRVMYAASRLKACCEC